MLKSLKILYVFLSLISCVFAQQSQNVTLSIQQGHMDDIYRIEVSPNNKFIATYGKDNKIVLWDYRSGNQIAFIYVKSELINMTFGHADSVLYFLESKHEKLNKWSVASMLVSETDQKVHFKNKYQTPLLNNVYCSINKLEIIWRNAAHKKLKKHTTDYFDQPFTSVLFVPKYNFTVASSLDGTIYVYNEKFKLIKQLKGHQSDVHDIALNSTQDFLFSVSTDRSIIKWDLDSLVLFKRYNGENYPAYGVSIHPSGNKLMFGDDLGYLRTMNLKSMRLETNAQRNSLFPIRQVFQLNDTQFVFSSDDNLLRMQYNTQRKVKNIKNAKLGVRPILHYVFNYKLHFFQEPFSYYNSVDINPAQTKMAVATSIQSLEPGYVRIYDIGNIPDMKKSRKLYTKSETSAPFAFFLNDTMLFTKYKNGASKLWKWNGDNLNWIYEKNVVISSPINVVHRLNETQLIVGTNKGVAIFDLLDASLNQISSNVPKQVFSLQHNIAAYSDAQNDFYIISKEQGINKINGPFVGHQDEITHIVAHPQKPILFSSSRDGSIKVWDTKSASLILTMIAIGNKNNIYVTPDNYYMMSNKGLSSFGFKRKDKLYLPEQFDAFYNRPDIVLSRLGLTDQYVIDAYHAAYIKRLKRLGFSEEMLSNEFHLPEIEVLNKNIIPPVTVDDSLSISLHLSDSKTTIDRVNIWINDVSIFGAKGRSLSNNLCTDSIFDMKIQLGSGQNKIDITCTNTFGAESYMESFVVKKNGNTPKPSLYLICVGINNYKDSRYNLKYAAIDADSIVKKFTSLNDYYKEVKVRKLLNETVTLENVQNLRAFLDSASIDDQVIIFIAGHGILNEKFDYYFASYDMDFMRPEKFGIPYEVIEALFDGIKPLKKLLFMDSCHSGEVDSDNVEVAFIDELPNNTKDTSARSIGTISFTVPKNKVKSKQTADLVSNMFTDLRKGTGATVVSASAGLEEALESTIWGNGLFTYCMINGIFNQKADLNNDGQIWLNELQEFVFEQVKLLSNGKQNPNFRLENRAVNYRLK
jgi:WD40 repeat protein